MEYLLLIIFFLFGLIIGSFLNVVICRYHTSRSFNGRSVCLSCAKELCWYDLLPVLSFFILKGRCRHCKSKFSWQYPLVEISTGIIFALLFYKFQALFWFDVFDFVVSFSFYATIFSLLVVISAYDLRHKIIPDAMVFFFGLLAFLGLFLFKEGVVAISLPTISELAVGPMVALPFAFLWLISKGTWMGLGDAKLLIGLGWVLGATRVIPGLFVAFSLGFVVGLSMLLLSKKYHLKSEIPFAPFLVLGTLLAFVFDLSGLSQLFII